MEGAKVCKAEYLQSKTKNPREGMQADQQNGCITHISVPLLHNIPACMQCMQVYVIQLNKLPTTGFSANTLDHRPQKKVFQLECTQNMHMM